MTSNFHRKIALVLTLILLGLIPISIPFFKEEWKESSMKFSLNPVGNEGFLKRDDFLKVWSQARKVPLLEVGSKIEYTIRIFSLPRDAKELGESLLKNFGLQSIKVYDSSYRLVYSSEETKEIFNGDLRLGDLKILPSEINFDSSGIPIYRSKNGEWFLWMKGFILGKHISLPFNIRDKQVYWIFKSESIGNNSLIASNDLRSLNYPNNLEEILAEFNKPAIEWKDRPLWEKNKIGDHVIFLSYDKGSRVKQLFQILVFVSFLLGSCGLGIISSTLIHSIIVEKEFDRKEKVLKLRDVFLRIILLLKRDFS
ncbi:hypothetical protein [Leptospira borgpetersenii]|uniref:hypothetical protein n=1 Tax=Leptospira borgpetersenii TaxID=174 RepID=UPI000774629F|nr:hypothetical protein [Leptospira borgpetersenii]MBE8363403.1 hypothetical protein [Leptospira borgpetersenii serovar Balcanica]MBE8366974.1 hypothetical protein [Leptospira borgpetersenii serovar Balcanica]MBE8400599.1 hypothetical protein [Leptospira borgpetersenii serovar Tarassovi]MBE8404744.1 hypothetical protein [Leptospira borgpetersenii serovar Tarassovi]MBE8407044.1 hypothetical protein [Leptospira borgpetersenii serovar Tarassovi]